MSIHHIHKGNCAWHNLCKFFSCIIHLQIRGRITFNHSFNRNVVAGITNVKGYNYLQKI